MNFLLHPINFVRKKLGIDRAISFVLIGRGVSLVSQPVTLFFITRFLSPVEQGFYFTFASVILLSVFLELGLGTIITQFASYEFAHLHWTGSNTLEGDKVSLDRLVSLADQTIKWYVGMASLFALLIIPLGLYFFRPESQDVAYEIPWILLVVFSSLNLVIYAFTSILEGCNKVVDIQKMKMIQSIAGNALIWILLFSHAGLLAAAALAFIQCALSLGWLAVRYGDVIRQILQLKDKISSFISWRKEILPLQWKIAISWISGYIVSQAINPVLFKFRGPVESGQMGMTMSIASIAAIVGLAWITAKSPAYGSLIKLNKLDELKSMVKKNAVFAFLASLTTSVLIILLVMVVGYFVPEFKMRFLGTASLIFLLVYNLANLIGASIGAYLRAFKQEPFLLFSILTAGLTGTGIFLSARFADAYTLCVVILFISLFFSLPYVVYIMVRFESRMRKKPTPEAE